MEVILPEGEEDMGGGRWKIMSGIKLLGHSKNVVWQPRPFALLWKDLASAVSISCTSRRDFCDPIRLQKRTAESINYEYS